MRCYFWVPFVLTAGYCSAQTYSYVPFPDSNAHWYAYSYITPHGGMVEFHTHHFLEGDTVIKNMKYHKVRREGLVTRGYLRTDSLKRTFFRYQVDTVGPLTYDTYDTLEHVIYDFSLEEGDTLRNALWNGEQTVITVIDSIRYILINNSYRKIFFTSAIGPFSPGPWIEGIGSTSALLGAYEDGFYRTATLCRFVYNDTTIYENPEFAPCGYFLSAEPEPEVEVEKIRIYPNPATESLFVQNDYNDAILVAVLMNAVGQKVFEKQLIQGRNELSLDKFLPGLYILKVSDDNGTGVVRKIIRL